MDNSNDNWELCLAKSKISSLEGDLAWWKRDADFWMDMFQSKRIKMSALEKCLSNAEKEAITAKNEVTSAKTEAMKQIALTEKAVAHHQAQDSKICGLKELKSKLEDTVKEQDIEVLRLKSMVLNANCALEKATKEHEARNEAQRSQIDVLECKLNTVSKERSNSESRAQAQEDELIQAKSKVRDAHIQLADLQRNFDIVSTESTNALAQVRAQKGELVEAKGLLQDAEERFRIQVQEAVCLNTKVFDLQQTIQRLSAVNTSLTQAQKTTKADYEARFQAQAKENDIVTILKAYAITQEELKTLVRAVKFDVEEIRDGQHEVKSTMDGFRGGQHELLEGQDKLREETGQIYYDMHNKPPSTLRRAIKKITGKDELAKEE